VVSRVEGKWGGGGVEFFNFKLGGTHSDTFSFKYVMELLNNNNNNYYCYCYFIKRLSLCLRHMLPDTMKCVVKTVKDSFNFERDYKCKCASEQQQQQL